MEFNPVFCEFRIPDCFKTSAQVVPCDYYLPDAGKWMNTIAIDKIEAYTPRFTRGYGRECGLGRVWKIEGEEFGGLLPGRQLFHVINYLY